MRASQGAACAPLARQLNRTAATAKTSLSLRWDGSVVGLPLLKAPRIIRPSPSGVKSSAACCVQKAHWKGKAGDGCKGRPGAALEHPSPTAQLATKSLTACTK